MIRKAIIVVLTLGASMTGLGWISTYWREFTWYRYDWESVGITWRVTWGEAEWCGNALEFGYIGDYTIDHVYLTATFGTFEIYFQRQLQQGAKIAKRGFDWRFLSYRYGNQPTMHRGGFHRFRRYRSTFAVPFIVLSAYPSIAFIRGPLRRHRRRRRGECIGCGYDLTGNESGVCPECGSKTDQQVDG